MKICFGLVFFITGLLVGGLAVSEESSPADERFAIVGDTTLSRQDYDVALSQTIRNRYYHGSIPQAELTTIRQQVADDLIDRTLLLAEFTLCAKNPDASAKIYTTT